MDKRPNIYLSTGALINPEYKHGMWRAYVLGKNYCSQSFAGLLEILGFFHSIHTSFDEIVVLPDPVNVDIDILSNSPLLEDRQSALRRLSARSGTNAAASQAVAKIKSKYSSFGAEYITKCLGRADFSEVKSGDIFDLVPNIVHREELIRELAERVKL